MTTFTPEYVGQLAHAFANAVASTPPDQPFTNRARLALSGLPPHVVRELGDAATVLADLARERLDSAGEESKP